jgi:hypothetical protein
MAAAMSTQVYNRAPVYVVDPEAAWPVLKRQISDMEGIELISASLFHLQRHVGFTARSRENGRLLLDIQRRTRRLRLIPECRTLLSRRPPASWGVSKTPIKAHLFGEAFERCSLPVAPIRPKIRPL